MTTDMSGQQGRVNRQRQEASEFPGLLVLDVFDVQVGDVATIFTYDPTGEVEWVAIDLFESSSPHSTDGDIHDSTSARDIELAIIPFCCTRRIRMTDQGIQASEVTDLSGTCVTIPYTLRDVYRAPRIDRFAAEVTDDVSRTALIYYSKLPCFDPYHWFERPRR